MGHRQGPADAHQDRRDRPERDGVRLHDEEQHQDDQDDHQDLDLDELVPDDLRHLVHDRRAAGDPHVLHQLRVLLLERVQCGCHGIDGLHGPGGHGGLVGRHGDADVVRTLGNRGIDDHLPAFGVLPSDDRSVAVGDEIDGGRPVLYDAPHRLLLGGTSSHVRLDHRLHRVSDVLGGGSVGGACSHRQDCLRISGSRCHRICDGLAPHERTVGVGDVPIRTSVLLDYAVAQLMDLIRYAILLGPLVGPFQRPFVHPVSGVVTRDGDVRDGFVQLHHGVIGHDHALVGVLSDELHPLPGIPVLHGADHVVGGLRRHRDVCRGDGDQDGHDEDRLRMLQREPGRPLEIGVSDPPAPSVPSPAVQPLPLHPLHGRGPEDPVPDDREDRWNQRKSGEEGHDDAQCEAYAHRRDHAEGADEHRSESDDDGCSGDRDGLASPLDRFMQSSVMVLSGAELLPVAGDDEDAVVASGAHHGHQQHHLRDEEHVEDLPYAVDQRQDDREGHSDGDRRRGRGDEGPEEQAHQDQDQQDGERIYPLEVLGGADLRIVSDRLGTGDVLLESHIAVVLDVVLETAADEVPQMGGVGGDVYVRGRIDDAGHEYARAVVLRLGVHGDYACELRIAGTVHELGRPHVEVSDERSGIGQSGIVLVVHHQKRHRRRLGRRLREVVVYDLESLDGLRILSGHVAGVIVHDTAGLESQRGRADEDHHPQGQDGLIEQHE